MRNRKYISLKSSLKDILQFEIITKGHSAEMSATTGEELMKFMVQFKVDMEKAMGAVRRDIDEKLETKLVDIEKNMEKMAAENRENEIVHVEMNIECWRGRMERDRGGFEDG